MAVTVNYTFANTVSEFVVNSTTADDQFRPDVVMLTNGDMFFTFDSDSGDPVYQDVMFRRFSSNGTALDANDGIITAGIGTDDEEDSAIAVLSGGNVVVVNEDNDAGTDDDVEFHIRTSTGVAVATQRIVTQAEGQAADHQTDPEVTALVGGGFAVVYVDQFAGSATNLNAEFVIFNNDGTLRSGPVIAGGSLTSLAVFDPTVTALTNGNFVVTWREDIGAGDLNVKFRIYNSNGVAQGAEVTVNSDPDDQLQPAMVALPGGGFAIAIRDQFGGSATDSELELRFYNASGVQQGGTLIIDSGTDLVTDPDLAVIANNVLLLSYTSNRNGNDDIFAQAFDLTTRAAIGSEFELEVTSGTQNASALSSVGRGLFVTAWQDSEAAGADNSAFHVSAQVSRFTRTTVSDAAGDVLVGDDLRDVMTGGGGNDTFVYGPAGNADVIADFVAGVGTVDRIDFSGLGFIRDVREVLNRTTQAGANSVIDFGSGNSLTLHNVQKSALHADDFVGLSAVGNDIDGNGTADVLWRHNDGTVIAWLTNGAGSFTSLGLGAPDSTWKIVETGDFNRDGKSDILWRNNDGTVSTWLMNSSGSFTSAVLAGPEPAWQIQNDPTGIV